MAAVYGALAAFANAIDSEERKRVVFLLTIGPRVYKLLCSLLSPDKPGQKSFSELVEVLKAHYSPKPSIIVQRFKVPYSLSATRRVGIDVPGGTPGTCTALQFQCYLG